MTSADLLLHPVRLRIVEAFLGDRALANPPKPGRKRRILGSVLLPGDGGGA